MTDAKAEQHIIDELHNRIDDLKRAKYALERFSLTDIESAYIQFTCTRTTHSAVGKLLGVSAVNVGKMIEAHRYLLELKKEAAL